MYLIYILKVYILIYLIFQYLYIKKIKNFLEYKIIFFLKL